MRGIPELVKALGELHERLIFANFREDDQFYYVSAGENFPERVRFFLHLQVDKFDGTVFVVGVVDGQLHKTEPITVTAQDALKRVRDLPAVAAYQRQVGVSFRDEVTADTPEKFWVQVGQQSGQGVNWSHSYLVSKVDLTVWEERVWPTEGTVPTPVTEREALALVERLPPAQKLKAEAGTNYQTGVESLPDGTWRVLLGLHGAPDGKLHWELTFYVEKAKGRVLSRELVAW